MRPDVEVVDLVKRYPKRETNAVDGLSFTVEPGEIFGLLGPNGAGKSTTIGVLTTRVKATSGSATVAGIDVIGNPVDAKRLLAVVPQGSNLDRSLTPRQNLVFHAAYHGFSPADRNARAAELLEQFGLESQADIKVDWYSGGMAQRLMIARAMMHEPRVLFLDEPTAGLDPQSRLFMWDRVRELRDKGVTVVLTTHDMDEAADMSDRVGIIDHGKLLALDNPIALTRGLRGQAVLEVTVVPGPSGNVEQLVDVMGAVAGVARAETVDSEMPAMNGARPQTLRLYVDEPPASLLSPVVSILTERGAELSNVHIGEPSLEDVFIDLTGRSLR
ncbi:MAG TPA: ABC transporter ATP-binding protein [Acidimicrobiia bacterium]